MNDRTVAAVILAAGASRRLGQPKQLVRLGSETLLERALRIAREGGCNPILVVLGADADLVQSQCDLSGARIVLNERWAEGMATSIQAALQVLHVEQCPVSGAILMVCDQPAVTAEHLRKLSATNRLTASQYGRSGVPAFFPNTAFEELAQLTGDAGARELLRGAETVSLPDGELDIDTGAELVEARRRFGS